MSDQKNEGLPIGDASHLLDKEPEPRVERSPMPVPISLPVPSDGPGSPQPPQSPGQPVAVMPGELVKLASSKELQAAAKRSMEPCPLCEFFFFPAKDSQDYMFICALISSLISGLPEWQRPYFPGRNPDEWGVCQGAPHGKRAAMHMCNSCEHFRRKAN